MASNIAGARPVKIEILRNGEWISAIYTDRLPGQTVQDIWRMHEESGLAGPADAPIRMVEIAPTKEAN